MNPSRMLILCAAAGALVAGLVSLRAAAPEAIQIGDNASYAFRETPVNGLGAKSLEDLRGKPVLFDFWGTR